jgi:polygalacturonase
VAGSSTPVTGNTRSTWSCCANAKAVIEDVIVLDSLGWTVHLSGSKDIHLSNTRIIGWRANSDGLDIEYSREGHRRPMLLADP